MVIRKSCQIVMLSFKLNNTVQLRLDSWDVLNKCQNYDLYIYGSKSFQSIPSGLGKISWDVANMFDGTDLSFDCYNIKGQLQVERVWLIT